MIVFVTRLIVGISFIIPILSTFRLDNFANCPKEALVNYSDINYNLLYLGASDISGLDQEQLNIDISDNFIDNDLNNETQICLCSIKVCIATCSASALESFQQKYVTINEKNQTVTFPLIYDSTTLQVMNETQLFNLSLPENVGSFHAFSRDPCNDELKLEFDQDEFQLLTNSSILSDEYEFLIDTNSYCFDFTDTGDFSAYICLSVLEIEFESHDPMALILISGMVISMPCLVITIIIYTIFRELRNLHCRIVRNYCICLLFAYLSFSIVVMIPRLYFYPRLCKAGAFIIHFSFLASFFWLNVMCFDIWWTFGGFRSMQGSVRQSERKKFKIYSIYAWGCASILTIVCLIMDLHPNIPTSLIRPQFGKEACWFMTEKAKAIYFYGPAGVTFACNIILFISTAIKIIHHKKETALQLRGSDSRRHDDNKQWFNLYLKLFIVMGINWSMEIISWLFKGKVSDYVWYVTDLANTLQGVIIFIIFVWKEKIKRLLLKRLGFKNGSFRSRNSTRSGYCSSTSTRTGTSMTMGPLQDKINSNPEMSRLALASEENDGI